jgi:nucleoside diphosphate kinase
MTFLKTFIFLLFQKSSIIRGVVGTIAPQNAPKGALENSFLTHKRKRGLRGSKSVNGHFFPAQQL